MLKEISDAEFNKEVLEEKGIVFVDFWAGWCGPCMMMAPVYKKISEKYPEIKFCKVDTTKYTEKASEYRVSGIPCIIIFKDGKEIDRLVGFRPEPVFEAEVKKYLSNA